ncbi:MAG: hypothetical protein K2Y56_01095 [Methylobacterium sp.]|uniref:hypothetical protein n=1 Tax=Methylobacterium sp. TaxID=409 RepID=UPI0025E2FA77|nr:hypothetical protein [Methylobacterium sp.]MBX9930131.1 hypothetical protein [Methylobacterium sp.]
MPWYAVSPRDPADPRWPMPQSPVIRLKADDHSDALAKFLTAYPSRPFGTPAWPVPDAGAAGFGADGEGLTVESSETPAAPVQP